MGFDQQHDETAHGILRADADTQLASLADLVRWVMQRNALPLVVAASQVIEKLRAEGDALALFETHPATYAKPVPLTVQIRAAKPRVIGQIVPQARPAAWGQGGWVDPVRKLKYQAAQAAIDAVNENRLDKLQRLWVEKASGVAVLDTPPLVRLAMPMKRAVELFDCGPERSWWEVSGLPNVPAVPQQPGLYPPQGLEGLPAHDGEAWGALLTDESPPRGVVRLADLVRLQRDRLQMPAVRRAAASVFAAIQAGPMPALFLLQPGDLARPVGADDVWCNRFPSGAQHRADWRAGLDAGFLSAPNCLNFDEARARRLPITSVDAERGFVALEPDEWLALPELPERRGTAGGYAWLARCWAELATSFEDLDTGPHAGLAILQVDAVRLFGRAEPVQAEAPAAAVPIALALGADVALPEPLPERVAEPALSGEPASPLPGTPAAALPAPAALLIEWEGLGGIKGKATFTLVQRYGVDRSTIQRNLNKARAVRTAATQASRPASSVFAIGNSASPHGR